MKKYFLIMMSILMVAMLSVGLASCSKDDDNKKTNPEVVDDKTDEGGTDKTGLLVRNWYTSDTDGDDTSETLIIFTSNGKFKQQDLTPARANGRNYMEESMMEGTYVYNSKTNVILVTITSDSDSRDNKTGDVIEIKVIELTQARLIVDIYNEEEDETFRGTLYPTNKTSLFTEGTGEENNPLVGNWFMEEVATGYHSQQLYTFTSDGTFAFQMKDENDGEPTTYTTAKGNYTYSSSDGTLTLFITQSNDSEMEGTTVTFDVVSVTTSAIIIRSFDDKRGKYSEVAINKTNKISLNDGENDDSGEKENGGENSGNKNYTAEYSGVYNGHKYVDLGLNVNWAFCNVDATSPEGAGGYYAWGETETKEMYSFRTYEHGNKMNTDGMREYYDIGKEISGTQYDVAHVKWGGKWRMPTLEERQELEEKCVISKTSYNGVKGILITGPNGNSVFLPSAGHIYLKTISSKGTTGEYWTGTIAPSVLSLPYTMAWGGASLSVEVQYFGLPVRPVFDRNN